MIRQDNGNVAPIRSLLWMATVAGLGFLAEGHAAAAAPEAAEASSAAPGEGIAAGYPGDAGLPKDSAVIFADDFESWSPDGTQPPAGTWLLHKTPVGRTQVVAGKVTTAGLAGLGSHVLEVACWKRLPEGSSTGGLMLCLGNYSGPRQGLGDGYEDLYVRYYLKFDENYHNVANHGSNLGGRDVTRKSFWVGQAGVLDVGALNYFYSGLQPYRHGKDRGSSDREFEMGFYSYHLDKIGPWGNQYPVQKQVVIRPGEWHCVERHMKLNSVDADGAVALEKAPALKATADKAPASKPPADSKAEAAKTPAEKAQAAKERYERLLAERAKANEKARLDGIEELWVDGQLTIRQAVRFRRNPNLRITYFTLENYYHGLPPEYTPEHPIKVCYDNVVVARKYIGLLHGSAPQPSER